MDSIWTTNLIINHLFRISFKLFIVYTKPLITVQNKEKFKTSMFRKNLFWGLFWAFRPRLFQIRTSCYFEKAPNINFKSKIPLQNLQSWDPIFKTVTKIPTHTGNRSLYHLGLGNSAVTSLSRTNLCGEQAVHHLSLAHRSGPTGWVVWPVIKFFIFSYSTAKYRTRCHALMINEYIGLGVFTWLCS
jgi:hypothetical protein